MNGYVETMKQPAEGPLTPALSPEGEREKGRGMGAGSVASEAMPRFDARVLFAIPIAACIAFAIHLWASKAQPAAETRHYSEFLALFFGGGILAAIVQMFYGQRGGAAAPPYRRVAREVAERVQHISPIIAAAILLLTFWEVITSSLRWLPMPYFPGPAGVLQSMIDDQKLLFDSTWHSLFLLARGYALGVFIALTTGVCIGWFGRARYWGMPLLKIIGPIPATAWIPLAMVLSPRADYSAVAVIALAVWFPVTMLTASGISNTRASYLDVARTLGARERYLIFRVAIPAAMPNIFLGLVMGLGAWFLALIVAETVGVKSGLGWYVAWAQGWAEYGKVYAALVIMAAFFSSIMTVLFKLRDRVLVWQKGVIKW